MLTVPQAFALVDATDPRYHALVLTANAHGSAPSRLQLPTRLVA
jgi:hypothetical protein